MHFTFTVDRNQADFYKINVEIVIDAEDHGFGFPCDASDATKLLFFALHHDCALDGWEELDVAKRAMTAVDAGRGTGRVPLLQQAEDARRRLAGSTEALSDEVNPNG